MDVIEPMKPAVSVSVDLHEDVSGPIGFIAHVEIPVIPPRIDVRDEILLLNGTDIG